MSIFITTIIIFIAIYLAYLAYLKHRSDQLDSLTKLEFQENKFFRLLTRQGSFSEKLKNDESIMRNARIYDYDLFLYVKSFCNNDPIFNDSTFGNITTKLRLENKKICLECGSLLKQINGKYGKFYGCIKYPKCTYTYNI